MLGLNEASDPAKEFGAHRFFIRFGVVPSRAHELSEVAFGPDQRGYRFGPALCVARFAAGQRIVRRVQRAPKPRSVFHRLLTFA